MTYDRRRNARNGRPSGQNGRGYRPHAPVPQRPSHGQPVAHRNAQGPAGPAGPLTPTEGVLELHPKGYGFLRSPGRFYAAQANDAYVSAPLVQRFSLREGLLLGGPSEPAG